MHVSDGITHITKHINDARKEVRVPLRCNRLHADNVRF